MKTTLYIKNMVCDRCKSAVMRELNTLGYHIDSLELGQVVLDQDTTVEISKLEKNLQELGFELLIEETDVLVEEIKIAIINKIENQDHSNLPVFLTATFNKSYSVLSKLFSLKEGITIEKYRINLKMEKVKELIQFGELNFSEIAYSLDYNNSGHLSKQFKHETGMSMTEFKNLRKWERKSIDDIV
ncbi:Helix-turn-helix domain-containing protein [Kaistella chaponensis]|uniref:Helix-turn-helix domain-containing protein n=1 Tax=Kaistella chaponensis TaxID=713588 RepID=A0A1N7NAY8_9FLAO|nr:helix-turn-helix domain-containing protein [Kaistella chaponensis]SIS95563.1 Helix-turn-helix domain-containing protein [Kaistella chaponensis]